MNSTVREVTVEELAAARERGVRVLDVRSPQEYAQGHVPGAVNVPLEELLADPASAGSDGVHVVCQSGRRSLEAARALEQSGVTAVSVAGGTSAWIESGREVEGAKQ
ncbi:rhodanese-like domain-containing protein [Streptomyces sp. RKND-216]|uniref:rhodanese-like domain-containing protein n=1 Tax=Streptomyces sp. RKND-216 TaxID=2562581 RepID=UPI00109E1E66|nr:rhodanese-like domain-containing protein [Streptomyces sp. RKND-216]THA26725.1 rhodanese-like domain-containing protein [Streptomyces sp. RKND-216]